MFEAAAKDKAPIVLYFAEEGLDPIEAGNVLHDAELAKISAGNTLFVMVEYNGDRTPSFDDGSPVPTSKLLSPNLSRDYDVTKYPTFIVCDWFGNEHDRHTKVPAPSSLIKGIESVSDLMTKANDRLLGNLEEARKCLEDKDTRKFFKAALKNFGYGYVGLEAAEETIKLYRATIDAARAEVDKILESRPEDGQKRLKDMSKDYRDTELESKIQDALDILKG
ncbi:MAG: hypothetical protein K8I27_14730 [Planctomycetes bacterium]|nr:hypothetical protein [Planctomycetota bacterium]